MPEFNLKPCPFCGGPKRAVSARYPRRARGRHAPKPILAGYEICCGMCGCHLRLPWHGATSKVAVRRALAAVWNARAPEAPIGPSGFRACPLCASVHIEAVDEPVCIIAPFPTRPAARCEDCGLAMIPRYELGAAPPLAEIQMAWNTRQSTADFRLLLEARCPPVDVERALSSNFSALMCELEDVWREHGGAPGEYDVEDVL